jgi:hypothetical protein
MNGVLIHKVLSKTNLGINWQHPNVIIQMLAQKFYTFENFPYDRTIEEWKVAHSQYVIDV